MHSWVRSRPLPHFVQYVRREPCCGVPHLGTDVCAQLSQMLCCYAKSRSLSAYQIFLDVVGAFDAVVRTLAVDGASVDSVDLRVAQLLSKFNLGPPAC